MKKLTIVTTYFNQEEWLKTLIIYWNKYYEKFVNDIDIIIVDDYSSSPAFPIVKKNYLYDNISVIRITEDLKFNLCGARNVGVYETKTDNMLMVDLDNLVCSDLIEEIFSWNYIEYDFYYRFFNERSKIDMVNNLRYQKSSNSFLLKKDLYTTVGGYPEELNGYYGYEDHLMYDYLEILLTKKYTNRKVSGNVEIDLSTICTQSGHVPTNIKEQIQNLNIKFQAIPIFSLEPRKYLSRGCKIINNVPLFKHGLGKSLQVDRNRKRNQKIYYKLLKDKLMNPVFQSKDMFLCNYELEC